MKKIIIGIISILIIVSLSVVIYFTFFQSSNYTLIVPKDEVYTQDNTFDVYDIKATDKYGNDIIDNVVVYGLELLKLEDDRITEFGSFSLRYTIEIDGEVVAHNYRKVIVYYNKDNLGGFIYNGDFLSGLNEWGIIDWKNSLDVSINNSQLEIEQNSVDEFIWDQSLYQNVEGLKINKKYKISFYVSSNNTKTIQVCLAQVLPSYPYSYSVMNEYDLIVNENLQKYEIEFICTKPTNVTAEYEFNIDTIRLEFKFGKYKETNDINSKIIFKDINIFEV